MICNWSLLVPPGKVIKQLSHSQYEVHWVDQTAQAQEAVHIFGPLTKRRPLRTGDHVLALADTSEEETAVPLTITTIVTGLFRRRVCKWL